MTAVLESRSTGLDERCASLAGRKIELDACATGLKTGVVSLHQRTVELHWRTAGLHGRTNVLHSW